MRPLFGKVERDENGCIVLGDPEAGCGWCDAPAVVTYSRDGNVAWWHPPTDCCDKRRAWVAHGKVPA